LDRIVIPSDCIEVFDGVIAKIIGEHKCIIAAVADHDIVAEGAGQRVVEGRAHYRLARSSNGRRSCTGSTDLPVTVEILIEARLERFKARARTRDDAAPLGAGQGTDMGNVV